MIEIHGWINALGKKIVLAEKLKANFYRMTLVKDLNYVKVKFGQNFFFETTALINPLKQ